MVTSDMKTNLDEEISLELNKISLENIKVKLIKLSSYYTRHTKSEYINEAADWLKSEFENIGYENTFFHDFTERIDDSEFKLKNIICNKINN